MAALVLNMPLDIEGTQEFRRLMALRRPEEARALVLRLWIELGYAAAAGKTPGYLAREDGRFLVDASVPEADAPIRALADLERSQFLVPAQDGWTCPLFARTNDNLGRERQEIIGSRVSHVVTRHRRLAREVAQMSLLIPTENLVRPDGTSMDAEEVRRVQLLVRGLDGVLGMPARQPDLFTRDVVTAALTVVNTLNEEATVEALKLIARHLKHPVLAGMRTEHLLKRWDEVMGALRKAAAA